LESKTEIDYNLEYFFELSPDWLCVAGFDGYFKKINPVVSKTLGYTEDELFSRPINSFVHPDDQHVTEHRRDLIKRGQPLLNFDNRYMTKTGETVWLTWTSMPIKSDNVVFAIAKNITHRKRLEEYRRLLQLMGPAPEDKDEYKLNGSEETPIEEISEYDQAWLAEMEKLVRKHAGKTKLTIRTLSDELYLSERQLHRRIQSILGVTPNKFIRIIKLQMAREAVAGSKHYTMAEIARLAGFETTAYFKKLFKEAYGREVIDPGK